MIWTENYHLLHKFLIRSNNVYHCAVIGNITSFNQPWCVGLYDQVLIGKFGQQTKEELLCHIAGKQVKKNVLNENLVRKCCGHCIYFKLFVYIVGQS